MKRALIVSMAIIGTLGVSTLAHAQPVYGPNGPYYSPYAPPRTVVVAPPPPVMYGPPAYDETHTGGGSSRAYSYWGAQKSN